MALGEGPERPSRPLPGQLVVGIGASAGGLKAFDTFFAQLRSGGGAAFVVIQHLDPRGVSILRELLGRKTRMPVLEARDGVPAESDHVYVMIPGQQLEIAN